MNIGTIHTASMSTPAPGALATAQPAVDTDRLLVAGDSLMELAASMLIGYEKERQELTLERDRLKQDCANLLAACQNAIAFIEREAFGQRSEWTIAQLKAAIKGAETK